MKTILVDDYYMGIQAFYLECGNISDINIVGTFTSPVEALAYAKSHVVEFALLDISMPGMDGFELFDQLKKISSDMIIVFATAYTAYAVNALKKKADYIIFKPYDREEIMDVIQRVRLLKARFRKKICCKTFGRFDVFIDGQPVVFKSAKAKEIFALCISRKGAPVNAEEIIDKLWTDYVGSVGECSIFRYTIKMLQDTLKIYNAQEVLGREKGLCFVHKDMIDCDYYRLLDGDLQAKQEFQGEFLSEYWWAENNIYEIQMKIKKVKN